MSCMQILSCVQAGPCLSERVKSDARLVLHSTLLATPYRDVVQDPLLEPSCIVIVRPGCGLILLPPTFSVMAVLSYRAENG